MRRNVIFEKAKFNKRVLHEDEYVDSFITEVNSLAEHCQFDTLHDKLIRDRLVVGSRDTRLAERLQLDAELTLEKTMTQARQSEAVKKQQILHREQKTTLVQENLDAVNSKYRTECAGWNAKVRIAQPEICFKMDTGDDEKCIPEKIKCMQLWKFTGLWCAYK